MPETWDDDALLASLRQALDERREVPPELIESGQAAFSWYSVDAELAELVRDFQAGREPEPGLRAETAGLCALTFRSPHLTVELEVTADALVGQVIPIQPATVTVQPGQGPEATVDGDELGCFAIEPAPAGMVRLHLATEDGTQAVTGWFEV